MNSQSILNFQHAGRRLVAFAVCVTAAWGLLSPRSCASIAGTPTTVYAEDAGAVAQRADSETPRPESGQSPDAGERIQLSEVECDRLYSHQLKIVQSDPDNPLYSSVQLNAGVLENPETRQVEIRHCRERVSRENFECQLAATDLAGLIACRRQFDRGDENGNPKPDGGVSESGDSGEAYFEEISTDENPGGGNGRPETMPSGRFAVNASNCERAYTHIYGVISKTKSFRERADRERLTDYWQSAEARGSFRTRCLSKFKPEDLGCLLSTRDADVLQGCLLVIPAG